MGHVPAWLTGLIMAVVFPLAVGAGFRVRRLRTGQAQDADSAGGAGYIVSAALGLLGLLIGFTFAMSAERYEARRDLVVEEANAISTTWLRQQLFGEPERSRLAVLMRDYVSARQALVAAGTDQRRLDAADARTGALQRRIWRETATALRTPGGAPLTTSVLQATNQMFDLAAARRAALDAPVPAVVLWTLIVFATAAAGLMGYGFASDGRRRWLASTGLFVLVAMAIALVIDLDQPRGGGITIPQTPLDRVAAEIVQGTGTDAPFPSPAR